MCLRLADTAIPVRERKQIPGFQDIHRPDEQPAFTQLLDSIPRMVHPVIGDRDLNYFIIRIYKTVRPLRIFDRNGNIYYLHGDRSAPLFPLYPLLLRWGDKPPYLAQPFDIEYTIHYYIGPRDYTTARQVS